MNTDNTKVNTNLLEENEALKKRIEELEGVLEKLILLKTHKDTHGKDEYYIDMMPSTWEMAKTALNNKQKPTNPNEEKDLGSKLRGEW